MTKTLLLLGGSRYILPVIEAAHNYDCRVITCDYLPSNYAHAFSDEYVNASIVDKEAVLKVASDVGADGIMSFAADPGVVSAAYAAEKLGLPFQGSYEAVSILQDKGRFRQFLKANGFVCPESLTVGSLDEARRHIDEVKYPVIVKPVDSAGSKGCSRVDCASQLKQAVEYAMGYSKSGKCIIEQFIEKHGDSSDADGFSVDGRLECVSFTSQLFDAHAENPYTPAAYSMPASMSQAEQEELVVELNRLTTLLQLRSGIYNIETRIGSDGRGYIMEMTPRGGGNRLSEMLRFASGVDLIDASVCAALSLPVPEVEMPKYDGYWYQQIVHSARGGVFCGVDYARGFREAHVVNEQLWVDEGCRVEGFSAANHAFGSIILRFDTEPELEAFKERKAEFMRVRVS